jgi:hypothetical protein
MPRRDRDDDLLGPGFVDDPEIPDGGPRHVQPREEPFGEGFDLPEPGRVLEHWHEPRYSAPYDRWRPNDYVFYSGAGYHREFIEPYKIPASGHYSGRGPKGYVRPDALIEEEVHEVLTAVPDVDASDVRIRVERGEVTLEGTVPDRDMKRLAEDTVEAVRGVQDVHNRLRVGARGRRIEVAPEARGGDSGDFGEIGGGSPPHYDRKAEQE